MPTFAKESSLLRPVKENLLKLGYECTDSEVQFFEYRMDVYGYSVATGRTVAVELKLDKWKRAFQQGLIYQLCADLVYVAVPMGSIEKIEFPLLALNGVGLIAVNADLSCKVLLEAQQSKVVLPNYRDFYVRLLQGVAP